MIRNSVKLLELLNKKFHNTGERLITTIKIKMYKKLKFDLIILNSRLKIKIYSINTNRIITQQFKKRMKYFTTILRKTEISQLKMLSMLFYYTIDPIKI